MYLGLQDSTAMCKNILVIYIIDKVYHKTAPESPDVGKLSPRMIIVSMKNDNFLVVTQRCPHKSL